MIIHCRLIDVLQPMVVQLVRTLGVMTLKVVGALPTHWPKLNIMSRTVKQAYRKSRRFDKQCRNNGSCSYCRDNRLHKHNKKLQATTYSLNTNEF